MFNLCVYSDCESEEIDIAILQPTGIPYKGDASVPVFSWSKTAFTGQTLVKLLLTEYEPEFMCVSQPVNVENNVSFLVDCSKLNNQEDIKCDDMGVWKHKGSPKRFFFVERNRHNDIINIVAVTEKHHEQDEGVYMVRRSYSENASDSSVRKVVATLTG